MNNTVEREISLEHLFWKILLGWRRLVALAVIFAILVTGMKYVKDKASYQAALKEQNGTEKVDKDIVLTKEEKQVVESAKEVQKLITDSEDYLRDSLLMNVDAFHENLLTIQFYVDTNYTYNYLEENEKDYVYEVIAAYTSYAKSGRLSSALVEAGVFDIEQNFVEELISTGSSSGTFQISVLHPDVEVLENLKPIIIEAVSGQTAEISKKIAAHTIELLSDEIAYRTDTDLARRQKEQGDILESYRSRLNAAKATMSEAQLELLEMEVEKADAEAGRETEEEIIPVDPPSVSIKYLILGVLAGGFLACVWIALEVLFSGKVQEADEIPSLYGVRMLGELTEEKKKKKFLAFIDTFLLKLKNRNKKQMSVEQQMKIICSNLELACKKENLSKLYLTGSEIEKMDPKRLAEIKTALKSAGVAVQTGENIIYDAGALKEMAEVGQVVFMEQVGASLYHEVEKEIRISRENEVRILGSIIVV